jgi:hypothetical protein
MCSESVSFHSSKAQSPASQQPISLMPMMQQILNKAPAPTFPSAPQITSAADLERQLSSASKAPKASQSNMKAATSQPVAAATTVAELERQLSFKSPPANSQPTPVTVAADLERQLSFTTPPPKAVPLPMSSAASAALKALVAKKSSDAPSASAPTGTAPVAVKPAESAPTSRTAAALEAALFAKIMPASEAPARTMQAPVDRASAIGALLASRALQLLPASNQNITRDQFRAALLAALGDIPTLDACFAAYRDTKP